MGLNGTKITYRFVILKRCLVEKAKVLMAEKQKKNTKGWSIKKAGDNLRLFMFYWL